jgi:S-adenosylmethionine:tRNA ribosyltransferase-isomerase
VRRQDFSFHLPEELIAQSPLSERSASRLLVLDGATGAMADRVMGDLPSYLRAGDLLVFNDTRVVAARIVGSKPSGGRVEIFLERMVAGVAQRAEIGGVAQRTEVAGGSSSSHGHATMETQGAQSREGGSPDTYRRGSLDLHRQALVQLRASKPIREGLEITTPGGVVRVVEREDELWRVEVPGPGDALEFFEAWGEVPLPPYIHRSADATDRERYQSIFAREKGAVAAPTASLHFDAALVAKLEAMGVERAFVTLHVGAGTFQPLRTDDLDAHKMHAERVSVSAATWEAIRRTREAGGRVIAVGTTVVRALESAAFEAAEFQESPHAETETPGSAAAGDIAGSGTTTGGGITASGTATAGDITAVGTDAAGDVATAGRAMAQGTIAQGAKAASASVGDVSLTAGTAGQVAQHAHLGPLPTWSAETRLFIRPGFEFQLVDAMVTNFHLPESTLLMLVSAFAGREHVLAAYAHAVRERYRFFSYGDAMLVMPTHTRPTSVRTMRATYAKAPS